jgi:DNA-binding transcriptional MerR regulator
MRIGELAERAGVSVRSLRYYEEQGLLQATRTPSGQRTYDDAAADRVRLIQQLYAAGLASRTILDIMPCVDTGHATPELLARLTSERDRITAQMASLDEARARLDAVIFHAEHPTPEHCPALRAPSRAA